MNQDIQRRKNNKITRSTGKNHRKWDSKHFSQETKTKRYDIIGGDVFLYSVNDLFAKKEQNIPYILLGKVPLNKTTYKRWKNR